jgi:tellurium resistance protein TerZ
VTVNMTKGQAISLQKNDGGSLTAVRMGLGWQAAPPARPVRVPYP